jgi:hypothetical protein
MEQDRREWQTDAFLLHLRRNILHYMRAIWSDEDYDQRMQRYSRMRVPIAWTFVPLSPVPSGSTATPLEVDGIFVPDPMTARPLTDVIDPIGPIGYHLNCAIYRIRDNPKLVNLHQALAYLRSAYTRFAVEVVPSNLGLTVRQAVAYSPHSFSADYTLEFGNQKQKWLIPVPGRPQVQWPETMLMPDGSIDAHGIRIWLDGVPSGGDELLIKLRVNAELEDPYLKLLQLMHPLPVASEEDTIFTDALLLNMTYAFVDIGDIAGKSWNDLSPSQKSAVKSRYHRYLMYRESGRLVTIDTPNLVLDLEASSSPALEPFKRLHRYVDVLKEFEEMRRRTFENRRRNDLIDQGELGDPEIDRVTLVSASSKLKKVIALPVDPED